jgi:DNA-binding transcriptional ArsR family regulator
MMTELTRDLLLHPVRLRIVQTVLGRRLTPGEIQKQMSDIPQASLYRHINTLEEGGLLAVVDRRPVRGGVERTYAVVEEAVSLQQEDLEGATSKEVFRHFATFVGTLLTDFAAYLTTSDLNLAADRVGFRQIPLWLTDAEFDELAAEFVQALQSRLDRQPSPERRRRLFTTIVMPDDRNPDEAIS